MDLSPLASLTGAAKNADRALELDQLDLMDAKAAFEGPNGQSRTGLSQTQFVQEFCKMCGEGKATQLSYLFMKIDCNSDGQVTWDEFLSYVMLQDKTKSQPLEEELAQSKFVPQESADLPMGQMHRDAISHVLFVPKTQSYVTASHDSSLRVWSGGQQLKPLHQIVVSERSGTGVNDVVALPDALGKLAVATAERIISFYELHDHVRTRGE